MFQRRGNESKDFYDDGSETVEEQDQSYKENKTINNISQTREVQRLRKEIIHQKNIGNRLKNEIETKQGEIDLLSLRLSKTNRTKEHASSLEQQLMTLEAKYQEACKKNIEYEQLLTSSGTGQTSIEEFEKELEQVKEKLVESVQKNESYEQMLYEKSKENDQLEMLKIRYQTLEEEMNDLQYRSEKLEDDYIEQEQMKQQITQVLLDAKGQALKIQGNANEEAERTVSEAKLEVKKAVSDASIELEKINHNAAGCYEKIQVFQKSMETTLEELLRNASELANQTID